MQNLDLTVFYIFLGVLFVASMALFGASVVADRWNKSDELTGMLFNLSAFCFSAGIFLAYFMYEQLVTKQREYMKLFQTYYPDYPTFSALMKVAFSGISKSLAVWNFIMSGVGGIYWKLSSIVPSVDDEPYIGLSIFGLVVGLIFAIGFIPFLEGVALVLGIIGTIIGIFIGLKKLKGKTGPIRG